jgi:N-acyl-L-homoserine lactone synthetase
MLRIKRAHSPELRDEIYALRYRAYRDEGAIDHIPSERFADKYDEQPNHVTWALSEHERVVGSIRTTWFDPSEPQMRIPELDAYADDVSRFVPAGKRILSGNRFVTEPDRTGRNSLFAMLLLRHYMLVAHQKADYALAAVRQNHLPFYRRLMRLDQISDGRTYPGLTSTMYLTACDFAANIDRVYAATPVLRPRGYERLFLDQHYQDVWELGLPAET